MAGYNPKEIEEKWQKRWEAENLFVANASSPSKKMYVLDMFPYPSGDGLHVGHAKIYTASDVVARYMRMKGFNVLHPMGWDAFGLPTENTAIQKKIHPKTLTEQNIERFRSQMQALGFSYDWTREINTTDPDYYKWTQWIFLQLLRMGLAYQDTVPINWCPSCKTGLANEEVVDGHCDRCGHEVEVKPMKQWLLKITKYADQLLAGLEGLDWPRFVKELQKNWIGRSEGTNVVFKLDQVEEELNVFTTRPDTLFGVTYVVLSPDHPIIDRVVTPKYEEVLRKYTKQARKPVRLQKQIEDKEKTGVFTGSYAVNPVNGEKVPIWVSDYVLMTYGSGAIMAVPAHDVRDFEFAQKFDLPIRQVIAPKDAEVKLPYMGVGTLMNSEQFDGQETEKAGAAITQKLQLQGKAKATTHYKLRDWVFSRQRYWGEPIPVIHCEGCGTVPVPEQDLPVVLPEVESYEPTGTGESPLAALEEWVNVKCPTCAGMGKRETDTMPQWAGSSWYWLRFIDPETQEAPARKEQLAKWMPIDVYVGGSEHAVLHLMYGRFWQMALRDAGVVSRAEPFERFRAVGLIRGEDNEKMSKSRGNVVNPDDIIGRSGADALRLYVVFMGPFEKSLPWDTKSIQGTRRFLERMWVLVEKSKIQPREDAEVTLALHQTIRRVSEAIENFRFNTGVAALMEFLNLVEKKGLAADTLRSFVLLLAPYAPHIAEELWGQLGNSQSLTFEAWPEFDQNILAGAEIKIPVQVNGKVRGELVITPGEPQAQIEERARELANVVPHLEGKEVAKVVYVEGRMINFVV